MLGLRDVHRSEPIYLCGAHAAEIGGAAVAGARGVKSSESAPAKIRAKDHASNSTGVGRVQQVKRHWRILLVAAILALAGSLLGPRLFRAIPQRSSKPAAIPKPQKRTVASTLPQKKASRKAQPAAPQKPPQAKPARKPQRQKRSVETAHVTAKGTIERRVLPDVPKSASDTIRGTILVSVQVQVDASGNVQQTKLVIPGPSRYFARLAVESAQRWKFNPPVVAGEGSQSEWLIRFYFTREATKAYATEGTG